MYCLLVLTFRGFRQVFLAAGVGETAAGCGVEQTLGRVHRSSRDKVRAERVRGGERRSVNQARLGVREMIQGKRLTRRGVADICGSKGVLSR